MSLHPKAILSSLEDLDAGLEMVLEDSMQWEHWKTSSTSSNVKLLNLNLQARRKQIYTDTATLTTPIDFDQVR